MGKYAGDHDNKEDPNDRYEKSQLYWPLWLDAVPSICVIHIYL